MSLVGNFQISILFFQRSCSDLNGLHSDGIDTVHILREPATIFEKAVFGAFFAVHAAVAVDALVEGMESVNKFRASRG